MGLVIMVNLVFMVIETNADASCYPDYRNNRAECPTSSALIEWLYSSNVVLLLIYTLECAARAFVERGLYVCNTWNLIDLFTMLAGWCATLLASIAPGLMVMRILRVARLVRLGRLMISIPELYTLVSGLGSSFKAILFGSVLLVGVIVVWSIIVVEFLHPINVEIEYFQCERCPRGFQTVFAACLTLFSQIVAGDQWSSISVPLAEHSPWTAPIMFFMMTTISLGVMNLILAVIVEKAAEARANDKARKKLAKENEREARMVELAMLCDLLDHDSNGHLNLDEMLQGFDTNETFWMLMQHFDISRSEVEVVFNVLSGGNAEVNYMEFCQHLSAFNKRDPLMIQQLIKYSVMELRSVLKQDVMEALQKQNEMLEDHLELLAHVPSCSQVAEDLKRRRSLREGAKGPPSTKTTQDPARPEREETLVPSLPSGPSLNLDEVADALEAACRSFESMEAELEEVIGKAEQIPKSLMQKASQVVEDVYHVKTEVSHVPSPRTEAFPLRSSLRDIKFAKTSAENRARQEDV